MERYGIIASLIVVALHAQIRDSGLTGVDGALRLTTPGTVVFDPRIFDPPLKKRADTIFHFTSIYVGAGVTLKLSSQTLEGPVFWLASGPVQIDGILDLNGDDAAGNVPAPAGAGGYPGGPARTRGYHPDGFGSNSYLVPLVGGFGGDGGENGGGGAGGGALLIASSASITINGRITANGGNSSGGAGGGGGAIRLVAPRIDGTDGSLSAKGGQPGGIDGRIRFETIENRFAGSLNATPFAEGRPFGLFLPPGAAPSVRILTVDGAIVPPSRDFRVNGESAVPVIVEARNVVPGTAVELQCFSDDGSYQLFTTTALAGTIDVSRASASVKLPRGQSHCYAKASWQHPVRLESRQ